MRLIRAFRRLARAAVRRRAGAGSALDGVPPGLSALRRAQRLGEQAAAVGFDWRTAADIFAKLDEETAELRAAMEAGDARAIAAEVGDCLFTLVNLARHLGVDAEAALHGTSARFERRFRRLEATAKAEGRPLHVMDEDELERRWQAAKRELGQVSGSEDSRASAAE